ncbi:MAG: HIT family protein [Muribaculaceae bacterium]|nr:HIT family protein [Muribaculaceae bacterium]MBQ1723772.1 HIT family protein [Muribaculaceae bacterium]
MATIFSRIAAGEIPSYKCAEDENYYAFLDINPLAKGHTLVIPKHEVNYIFDIEDEEYKGLWAFAKKVAVALKAAVPCERIGVAVIGLEVPHAHIHLVPINKESDMDFRNKKQFPADEMAAVAARVFEEFSKL